MKLLSSIRIRRTGTVAQALLGAAMVILTATGPAAVANSEQSASVMRALAEVKSAKVDFVEVRELGFLTKKIIVKGQMSYEFPDKLRRVVSEPFVEEIIIEGDTVTWNRETDPVEGDAKIVSQRVSLESSPVIRSVVESVRSTLAGDLSRLEELFTIEWQGSDQDWTMMLIPTDEHLQDKITSIQLTGSMSTVATVTTVEADGDESFMTLTYQTSN